MQVSYSLQKLYGAGLKLGHRSLIVPYLLEGNVIILQVIALRGYRCAPYKVGEYLAKHFVHLGSLREA